MVTMAQSGAPNWRNTHTHMDTENALTHTRLHHHSNNHVVRSASSASYYFSAHAGSFPVSIIHRTLTRGGLQDLYCASVIILARACTPHGGWAHRQRVSITFLTRKNSQMFLVLLTAGFEPSSFGSDWESDALLIEPPPSPQCGSHWGKTDSADCASVSASVRMMFRQMWVTLGQD